jgi:hypothetical protein
VEPLDQLRQRFERHLLVFEDHEQEANDEVHPLAVLDLLIEKGVRLENISEHLCINPLHVMH